MRRRNRTTRRVPVGTKVLATFPSSSGGARHQVRLGANKKRYCTCAAWRFSKSRPKKWCKHIIEYALEKRFGERGARRKRRGKKSRKRVASATALRKLRKRMGRRKRRHHRLIKRLTHAASLYVYHTGWTPAMNRSVSRLKNEGGGCCTNGYRDDSFAVKDPKRAIAIAKKLAKVQGVGWVDVKVYGEGDARYDDMKTITFGRKPRSRRMSLRRK